MSLSSTSTIKYQLTVQLGAKAGPYFESLTNFVVGRSSRIEFEEAIRQLLDVPTLVQLHNALIISLFDATTSHKRPPTPPPAAIYKPPPRKRRRALLPYQGTATSDDALTLRSARLKRWTLAAGKRERDRILSLQAMDAARPKSDFCEVSSERGVLLSSERGDPPGSRLPVHLFSVSRAPTLQHIADRMNLICAQNNLGPPTRAVPSLMNLACEAKLKQLITHALTLTSTSHAISSIKSSTTSSQRPPPVLSPSSFQNVFTLSPADLPNKSATAMRLALGEADIIDDDDHDVVLLKDREVRDQRWQIVALLGERSTIRDGLRGVR